MADLFEKILIITLIYGILIMISARGASGDLVRFACAIGMLVFLTGKINNMTGIYSFSVDDMEIVEQNASIGEEMFKTGFNEQISEYIENDIEAICRKYGAEGEVKIELNIEDGHAEIEKIMLIGNFESGQGMGFIKNEIINKYNVDEVKIVENKY